LLCISKVHAGPTADASVKKGFIRCGVNTGLAGFSQPDSNGEWRGIDADLCRAGRRLRLFGDIKKLRYTPLTAQQRFTALQSGEWTFFRATPPGHSRATPASVSVLSA
jgi:general L-amino acid transport system substrate-binding protein